MSLSYPGKSPKRLILPDPLRRLCQSRLWVEATGVNSLLFRSARCKYCEVCMYRSHTEVKVAALFTCPRLRTACPEAHVNNKATKLKYVIYLYHGNIRCYNNYKTVQVLYKQYIKYPDLQKTRGGWKQSHELASACTFAL